MGKKLAWWLVAAGVILAVNGCNTIEGAGKGIKAAGGAIEKTAEKTKPY
jgi:predicted small secreted protein